MLKEKTGDPEATSNNDGDKEKQEKEELELTSEELINAIKEANLTKSFEKYVKEQQDKEADRRVSQAILTHDLKLKKEAEEAEAKKKAEEEKKKGQANMSDTEKTIANLTEQIGNLTNMVKGLGESTIKAKRETLIKDSLKKAGLSEGFSKYIIVDKDEDIEENVKNLKDQILGLQQAEIDKRLKDGGIPAKGEAAGSIAEETAKKFAQERNKGSAAQPFQGFDEKEIVEGKEIKK